jgi:hypothetical protein
MRRDEYGHLLAERGTLHRLLEDTPEEDVIDRGTFLSRLAQIERRIEAAAAAVNEPAQTRLTFRGAPVIRGRGISADFALSATKAFVDAVILTAASIQDALTPSGKERDRDQYRMLITGPASGAFGFELEELPTEQIGPGGESPVSQALQQIQSLLRNTLDTDGPLTYESPVSNPKARMSVHAFLDVLVRHEAVCTLDVETSPLRLDTVSFQDVDQVRRSMERLSRFDLHEQQGKLRVREERPTFETGTE